MSPNFSIHPPARRPAPSPASPDPPAPSPPSGSPDSNTTWPARCASTSHRSFIFNPSIPKPAKSTRLISARSSTACWKTSTKTDPHETDEAKIAGYFSDELDREAARHYGRHPAPVVRVQIEAMRVRLRQLAFLQAAERRDGWRILESEYAVKKEDGLAIGPLTLTGTMDRVEVHEEKGLRILDYKTFAKARPPEETHFGPARESHHLPEAAIARPSRNGALRVKSWTDLQLPLYRRLAAQIWPDHAAKGLAAGYILLPADPDDTQISLLSLDEAAQSHAETCAVAIAGRVAQGIFWPPAPAAKFVTTTSPIGSTGPIRRRFSTKPPSHTWRDRDERSVPRLAHRGQRRQWQDLPPRDPLPRTSGPRSTARQNPRADLHPQSRRRVSPATLCPPRRRGLRPGHPRASARRSR